MQAPHSTCTCALWPYVACGRRAPPPRTTALLAHMLTVHTAATNDTLQLYKPRRSLRHSPCPLALSSTNLRGRPVKVDLSVTHSSPKGQRERLKQAARRRIAACHGRTSLTPRSTNVHPSTGPAPVANPSRAAERGRPGCERWTRLREPNAGGHAVSPPRGPLCSVTATPLEAPRPPRVASAAAPP